MATLYQVAASNNGIVVGTGNKVEDFGIGFYTKYGDGGVDISPIADCTKSQIWEMGKKLGILKEILSSETLLGFISKLPVWNLLGLEASYASYFASCHFVSLK